MNAGGVFKACKSSDVFPQGNYERQTGE